MNYDLGWVLWCASFSVCDNKTFSLEVHFLAKWGCGGEKNYQYIIILSSIAKAKSQVESRERKQFFFFSLSFNFFVQYLTVHVSARVALPKKYKPPQSTAYRCLSLCLVKYSVDDEGKWMENW
jgi:hypothetical protein